MILDLCFTTDPFILGSGLPGNRCLWNSARHTCTGMQAFHMLLSSSTSFSAQLNLSELLVLQTPQMIGSACAIAPALAAPNATKHLVRCQHCSLLAV